MGKTNDNSKFYHAKLENRVLADSELEAVNGGMEYKDKNSVIINAVLGAMVAILHG